MSEPFVYLDPARLAAVDRAAFQSQRPYPWMSLLNVLTDAGYRRLCEALPDVRQMLPSFGVQRAHGQPSHDRYALEYNPDVDVAIGRARKRPMRARVADPDERARLWPQVVARYKGYGDYQTKTDREIPLVLLEPRP